MIPLDDEVARRQDCLGQLFHKQGHAVGSGDDLSREALRQRPAADDLVEQRAALRRGELRQVDFADAWPLFPGRLEFGPRGDQQQRRDVGELVDDACEHVEGRRIGPMGVLEQHQGRLGARLGPDGLNQHAHGVFSGELGRDQDRPIAVVER